MNAPPHLPSTPGESPTAQHDPSCPPAPTVLRLEVVEGPDQGKRYLIDPSAPQRILIGTSPACDIRLTDATVSRRHASIEPLGAGYRIADLGSTNGTSVNGVRAVEVIARGGETLCCGATTFKLAAERQDDPATVPVAARFGKTLGASEAMRRLYPLCERLAALRLPVLVEGETGTGKEVLAESLHQVGGAAAPFVVFDCASRAPSLIEAELFGSGRASAGEDGGHVGAFERARGGTLCLDEIGELPELTQAKLIRALERAEYWRVGGSHPIPLNARIIATSRRDLDREVAKGRFRDDLFRRFALARIELPPLRERRGDVTLLARHFAEQLGAPRDALPPEVLEQLEDYPWPGNVRELHHVITRRIALGDASLGGDAATWPSDADRRETRDMPSVERMVIEGVPFPIARRRVIEAFEKQYVQTVLDMHGGHVERASGASGIALRYFQVVKARSNRT